MIWSDGETLDLPADQRDAGLHVTGEDEVGAGVGRLEAERAPDLQRGPRERRLDGAVARAVGSGGPPHVSVWSTSIESPTKDFA